MHDVLMRRFAVVVALAGAGSAACNAILGLDEVERMETTAGAGAAGGSVTSASGSGGSSAPGTCADPIPITNVDEVTGTLENAVDDVVGICGNGPELVYSFTATGDAMLAELIPQSIDHDLALSIRTQ